MTTEHAAPAAGFDTRAAVLHMKDAGVPEEQGAAMMYAAIAAANARVAEERAVAAAERREARRERRAFRREIRRDMEHMGTRIRLWIAGSAIAGAGLTVGVLRFLAEWPR